MTAEIAARRASEADAAGGGESKDSGIIRACDQCRLRKIRCDKESPCSNCRIANRHCSSTGVGQKPREARQRVLISTQYERKIDHIEERLGSIERLLRELVANTRTNSHPAPETATLPVQEQPHHHAPTAAAAPSESEHAVSAITAAEHHQHPQHDAASGASPTPSPRLPASDDLDDASAFEGNSSLTAHTQFASDFLEHAVSRTSITASLNPSITAALSSLKQIVGLSRQHHARGAIARPTAPEVRFAHQHALPSRSSSSCSFRDLPMPPIAAVISVLREIKETPPGTFTLISVCCFMAVDHFTEACRRVYFALDEDFSQATFIIVNTGLYYLFQEKAVLAGSGAGAEFTGYYELCRANLETGLAHLRFFLGASMETIEALLLGASYAIEVSRPSLAWQLNTTAAQLCQDLGYHRVVTGAAAAQAQAQAQARAQAQQVPMPAEAMDDKKAILFWFSYMLDRGLALRLGRAPVIQDFDVTLPRVVGRQVNATDMWKEILKLWIAHADVQGQIYEKLYSPSSLAHPVGVRVEAARALAARLKGIAEQAGHVRAAEMGAYRREGSGWAEARKAAVSEMVMKSDQVSFLSSLTLVYRALPPGGAGGTFTAECIETARMAMQTHEECMRMMGSNLWVAASYIHWTILYAPFVPFIVIFCHIIETSDVADLQRLRDFIDSLQPTCAVSEGIEKLHRLFSVLYNVAMLYVEAKSKSSGGDGPHTQDTDMAPIGNEFDVYLSALGFMPVDEHAAAAAAGGGMPVGAAVASLSGSPTGLGGDAAAGFAAAAGSGVTNAMALQQHQHQTTQLGDWFSGNRYMMGLLEEDLSQFQPNAWSSGGV